MGLYNDRREIINVGDTCVHKNRTEGLHFLQNTNAHRFCFIAGCEKCLLNSSGLLVAKFRPYKEETAGRFVGGIVIDIGQRPTPDHYVGKNCGV